MNFPGNQLESLAELALQDILLVAPFVKSSVLQRVLNHVSLDVTTHIVTRWRADEIVAGVSDLDIWRLICDRPNAVLWLRSNLHAKYYRVDRKYALVGSANLTNTALGWSRQSNLEILIKSPVLTAFEEELFRAAIQVDESIYQHIKQITDAISKDDTTIPLAIDLVHDDIDDELQLVSSASWLPSLRHPEKLYVAYQGKIDQLTTASRSAVKRDLIVLNIPSNLIQKHFEAYVGVQLLQMPIIKNVDKFVEVPQRFGAVRDYLRSLPGAHHEGFDPDLAWQTLMRWLLYFLPNRYRATKANYSEIFQRID